MKKLILVAAILASLNSYSQGAKMVGQKGTTKPETEMDTVLTGSRFAIYLDSAYYVALREFISSIPPGVNKLGGQILSLVDGSQNNVGKYPVYALKPKTKK